MSKLLSSLFALALVGMVAPSAVHAQGCDSLPDHFSFTNSTPDSFMVILDSVTAACGADTCDEVGVFDGDLCVGAAVIDGVWPLSITAWADDSGTPEVDGYTAGNDFALRVWRAAPDSEIVALAHHQTIGDGTFDDGDTAQLWLECCEPPEAPGAPVFSPTNPCPGTAFSVAWNSQGDASTYYWLYRNDTMIYTGFDTTFTDSIDGPEAEYAVAACDECGCGPVGEAAVIEMHALPEPPSSFIGWPDPVCAGDLFCLTWTAAVGATHYEVQEDDGDWVYVGNVTQRCITKNEAGTHIYRVRSCDGCGCGEPSDPDTLTIEDIPAAPSQPTASPDPACISTQYCITWDSVEGATYYEIREDSSYWVDVGTSTQACYTKSTVGLHTYEVRACNDCGCSSESPTKVQTVQTIPITPSSPVADPNPVCVDAEFCLSWEASATATSYELSLNSGDWFSVGDTTEWCSSHDAVGTYGYRLRACNSCGCSSASSNHTVTVQSIPDAPSTPSTDLTEACLNEEYCLSWVPVSSASYYEISEDGGDWIDLGSQISYCTSQAVDGAYSYRVRAGNSCGVSGSSDARTISVRAAVIAPEYVTVDYDTVCTWAPYCINWSQVIGAEYYELRADSGTWVDMGTSVTTCYAQITGGTHVYEVRACDYCDCSEPAEAVIVVVLDEPAAPDSATASVDEACVNEDFCLSWSAVEGAATYQIRNAGGEWFDIGDTTEICLAESTPGGYSYDIRACNECGCGGASDLMNVLVKTLPAAPTNVEATPNPVCIDATYCVGWSEVIGATRYEIRVDSGDWSDLGAETSVCYTHDEAAELIYEVRACDTCGCGDPSDPVTVDVTLGIGTPSTPIASDSEICVGEEVCFEWETVDGASGYELSLDSLIWTDVGSELTSCQTLSAVGTIRVWVRACGDCGCGLPSAPAQVEVLDLPSAPDSLTPSVDTTCAGGEVCLIWPAAEDADYYELLEVGGDWQNLGSDTSTCLTVATEGIYHWIVRACNDCGCTEVVDTATVFVEASPHAAPIEITGYTDEACVGSTFEITWSQDPSSPEYQWRIDSGAWVSTGTVMSASFTGDTAAVHLVEVRACSDCGCSAPTTPIVMHVVGEPPAPEILQCYLLGDDAHLVWSSTPYAKRYRVYRDRYYQATVTDTTWSAEAPTDKVSYYFIEADNDCDRTVSLDTCGLAGPTDVAVHDWTVLPTEFTLGQNYPNPFNPETRIEFGLPRSAHVKLEILNLLGQRVRVLVDASRSAGWHSVWWDGRDETGRVASSGVYFYRMQADEFNVTRKMILLR